MYKSIKIIYTALQELSNSGFRTGKMARNSVNLLLSVDRGIPLNFMLILTEVPKKYRRNFRGPPREY
jgi:hypothetical protein